MDEDGNPDSGDGHQPAPGQHSFVSAKDPVGYEHIADSERTPGVGPGAAEMPDLADRQPFQQGCRGDGGVDFAQTSGSHNHDELSIVAPPEGLASESKRPAVLEDLDRSHGVSGQVFRSSSGLCQQLFCARGMMLPAAAKEARSRGCQGCSNLLDSQSVPGDRREQTMTSPEQGMTESIS